MSVTVDKVMNKFSVAMCVYGGDNAEWFRMAADSVLNQTVPPDEVVLVVDGPVPEELERVIRVFEQRPDFKVVWLKVNQGHGNARRASIDHCSNELVALMDADDICVPNRFELQLKLFGEDPTLDISGGIIHEFIDEPEHVVGVREVPCTDAEIKEFMKMRCPMNQVTVMLRKSCMERAGGYVDWFCNEDYYLWVRMSQIGARFANVPAVLVRVRVGKEMYQRRGGVRYFKSEAKLQKYMLDIGVIDGRIYLMNVLKRLIVQVLMPNWLRGFVFRKFARTSVDEQR